MNAKKFAGKLTGFAPIIAVFFALLIGVIILLGVGANPLQAYRALFLGAFGSWEDLINTVVKATPLLFVAIGVTISFRGGVLNIGGQGQLITGALTSTAIALAFPNLPGWLLIFLCLVGSSITGGIWGGIAGYLKAYFSVNEILGTIMLNYIAGLAMNYLLRGPMIDPLQKELGSYIPQTAHIPSQAFLPRLPKTPLHLGVLIAVLLAILAYIFLWKTTIGFRLRTTGENLRAARGAGINVNGYRVLALFLAGAFSGLGGGVQVLGVYHRMFTTGSALGFTGSAGFNGIVAALFGHLHPLGSIPSSFFFGALITGGNSMQRMVQVPSALITAISGLVVIFVVGSEALRTHYFKKAEQGEENEES